MMLPGGYTLCNTSHMRVYISCIKEEKNNGIPDKRRRQYRRHKQTINILHSKHENTNINVWL